MLRRASSPAVRLVPGFHGSHRTGCASSVRMKLPWSRSAGPLGVSAGGLLVGGLAWLLGSFRVADTAWAVGTVPVLLVVAASIANSLRRGDIGVDILALLSMAGALALGHYLAGILIALMFSTGRALEDHARARARRELSAPLPPPPNIATPYHHAAPP